MATIDEIKQQAEAVKNATQVGENTAERVGGALSGLADISKAQEDNIGKKFDKENVVQEFGDSEEFVMSQKLLSEINNSLTKGKYIGLDGTIKELSGWNATLFYISIDNVKSFSIKASKNALCIAYYDSNLKFISGIEVTGGGLETYTEEVLKNKPANAKYVRFSYTVAPFKLELYTGNPNINDGLIEFIDNKINNSLTKGKYIGLDGTIKELSGWNATLFYISIDNVKSFSIKASKNALCIAYYDSNLKFISGIEGTGGGLETYTEEVLKNKPANAKYVRFSYTVAPFKLELYTGNPNINDGLIEFIDNKINNSLTKGKYIGLDGTIKELSGWNATLFYISIDNVKSFSIKASKNALCIAYYDSNLKFISGIEGTGGGLETYTEEVLKNKPSNAKYVRFSYTVAPFKLELYTGNPNINDSLIEFVDNVASAKIVGVNAWNGKSCAFLGDSITDPIHVGTSKNYWQYLGEILGIKYKSYGQNGAQSSSMLEQAQRAHTDNSNYDAIFIFFGTNDFNANVPIGNWYEEENKETTKNGQTITLKHRIKREDTTTFKNRLNRGLSYIKKNFPNSQVIMMTPIHRAYAEFGSTNQQPDESFANAQGLYISDYVDAVKECANVWATELIDLNSISGLYPLFAEYSSYFHDARTDMLHPNANGHFRMAQAIAAKMNSISCLQKPQN